MKKTNIIAEQYLEVCSQKDGTWNVELVIETLPTYKLGDETVNIEEPSETLRHCLSNFKTMEEGDEFANVMRFYYDKSIFKYELM